MDSQQGAAGHQEAPVTGQAVTRTASGSPSDIMLARRGAFERIQNITMTQHKLSARVSTWLRSIPFKKEEMLSRTSLCE